MKKITRFDLWFIAVCLFVILWAVTSCHYPNQSNVVKIDKTKKAQFR